MPTPGGAACYCRAGFASSGSGACLDVDECADGAAGGGLACSQICANAPGSFSCSCAEGYSYRDPTGGAGGGTQGDGLCYASSPEMAKMFYATKNKVKHGVYYT